VLLPGEIGGLSISPHQISVLGLIQEQSPTATLTLNGMPASPHQIAVLAPRTKWQTADKPYGDRASNWGACPRAGRPKSAAQFETGKPYRSFLKKGWRIAVDPVAGGPGWAARRGASAAHARVGSAGTSRAKNINPGGR
jgi:hypothetical protein